MLEPQEEVTGPRSLHDLEAIPAPAKLVMSSLEPFLLIYFVGSLGPRMLDCLLLGSLDLCKTRKLGGILISQGGKMMERENPPNYQFGALCRSEGLVSYSRV